MANTNITQHCFNHGELSPIMKSRSDLEIYNKALSKAYNVVVKPEGVVRRRFATKFIYNVTSDIGDEAVMLSSFDYDADTTYTVVFTEGKITILYEDELKATLTTSYSATELKNQELRFAQTVDALIVTHKDHEPSELKRVSDTSWTFSTMTFKALPTHDFRDVDYDGFTFTLGSTSVAKDVTLISSSAIFSNQYVGGIFIGLGETSSDELGVARITSYTDSTHVKVNIILPFAGSYSSGASGKNVFLGEPVWSSNRGYPISCTLYEGRLWFGGMRSVKNFICGSVSGNVYNFDRGTGADSDAIEFQVEATVDIKHIFGGKSLQIFTSREEFGSAELDGKELTPSNMPIKLQSRNGIENVAPQVLDNQTFYVKRGGKGIMNMIYDDAQSSYKSQEVSIVSSHLIKHPIDAAVLSGSRHEASNYLFVLNDDGSVASYQTMMEEKVSAWTDLDFSTDNGSDKVIRIEKVGDDVVVLVKRTIDSVTQYYIEKFVYYDIDDGDYYLMDCCVHRSLVHADTLIDQLDVLEGRTVQVIADGYYAGEFVVENGTITIGFEAKEIFVGLGFTTEIYTLPIDIEVNPVGRTGYINKRIVNVTIDYTDSYGIYVNDTLLVPFLEYGGELDYSSPETRSGIKKIDFLNGWEPRAGIKVSQKEPTPMTILALNYEMSL